MLLLTLLVSAAQGEDVTVSLSKRTREKREEETYQQEN